MSTEETETEVKIEELAVELEAELRSRQPAPEEMFVSRMINGREYYSCDLFDV